MTLRYIFARALKKLQGTAVTGSSIHREAKVNAGSHVVNTRMDRYSYCGYDCEIVEADIGAFCSIAGRVAIGGARHPEAWVSTSPAFHFGRGSIRKDLARLDYDAASPRTRIDSDVWIGYGAMVRSGVHIGVGAVVGMGSVVTKDVAPYTVVAGNPAREIRRRFDEPTVTRLLDSRWWELPGETLERLAGLFNDPEAFLKEIEKP